MRSKLAWTFRRIEPDVAEQEDYLIGSFAETRAELGSTRTGSFLYERTRCGTKKICWIAVTWRWERTEMELTYYLECEEHHGCGDKLRTSSKPTFAVESIVNREFSTGNNKNSVEFLTALAPFGSFVVPQCKAKQTCLKLDRELASRRTFNARSEITEH